MGLFKNIRLKYRMMKRLGAFARAREQGMSIAEARAYADSIYPPTPEDIEYQERERQKKGRPGG